jgi:peptide deformylase
MALLPIYNSFHPVLNKPVNKVDNINGSISKLIDDMFETMYKADGIGLAGNQVGRELAVVTIDTSVVEDVSQHYPPISLINPVIESFSDNENDYNEGCLSVPKFFEKVTRPDKVRVRYYDLSQKENVLEAEGLLARVIQHEVDHLNGILFYERLTPMRRTLAKNKLKKIRQGKVETDYAMVNDYNGKRL